MTDNEKEKQWPIDLELVKECIRESFSVPTDYAEYVCTLIDRQPMEEEVIMIKEMLLESERDYCCCSGCKRKGDIIRKAFGIEANHD